MSRNGRHWRLLVRLPPGYGQHTPALFEWLRTLLIPALLRAPMQITVEFVPPDESDRDIDETE